MLYNLSLYDEIEKQVNLGLDKKCSKPNIDTAEENDPYVLPLIFQCFDWHNETPRSQFEGSFPLAPKIVHWILKPELHKNNYDDQT